MKQWLSSELAHVQSRESALLTSSRAIFSWTFVFHSSFSYFYYTWDLGRSKLTNRKYYSSENILEEIEHPWRYSTYSFLPVRAEWRYLFARYFHFQPSRWAHTHVIKFTQAFDQSKNSSSTDCRKSVSFDMENYQNFKPKKIGKLHTPFC